MRPKNTDLKTYLPNIYDYILEMNILMETENDLFETLHNLLNKGWFNQFIPTADAEGISLYERLFGIIANPAIESLEFRRSRLISRMNMLQPFTVNFLKQKLNELIGVGQYELLVYDGVNDVPMYTLVLEASAVDQQWYGELLFMLNQFKPANTEFINRPLLTHEMMVAESISLGNYQFNYRLGTSWVLGKKPFADIENKGVIKMATTTSIKNDFLGLILNDIYTKPTTIRLNGNVGIPITGDMLGTETVDGKNYGTITYEASLSDVGSTISLVELLKDSTVLTSSVVYIPVTERVILKHRFEVKEGA